MIHSEGPSEAPRFRFDVGVFSKRSIDAAIDDGGDDEVKAKPIGGSLPNTMAGGESFPD